MKSTFKLLLIALTVISLKSYSQNSATVVVNQLPTITLTSNSASLCQGETSTSFAYSATTQSPTLYSIDFNAAAEAQGFVDVTDAALPASPISVTVPGTAALASYNATLTVKNATCTSNSYAITIAVTGIPSITGTTPGSNCGTGTVSLGATASAGTINWYAASSGGASLGTGASFTTPSISSTTSYWVDATSGSCVTASRTEVVATIYTVPTITFTSNSASVCSGITTASFAYSATTQSPTTYSVDFDATAEAEGFADATDVALPASPISLTVPGAATAGTYNANITVKNANCTSATYAITITINTIPTITASTPGSNCGTGTVNLGATASAGTINWYAASSGGASLGTGASFTTPSISSTTSYWVDATSNGCTSSSRTEVIATIYSLPTITLSSNSATICKEVTTASFAYSATTQSPTTYSVDFDATAEAEGFADATDVALPASPVSLTVPGAAAAGTYNANITVKNANCTSSTYAITITILPLPTATISVGTPICEGTNTNLTFTLTGTANWILKYSDGTTTFTETGITASPKVISVSPSVTTTYTITEISDANCTDTTP